MTLFLKNCSKKNPKLYFYLNYKLAKQRAKLAEVADT